jgi:exosortase
MDLIRHDAPLSEDLGKARQLWFQVPLLGILLGSVYFSILRGLVQQWWQDPNYSHGFFVPLFSAWIIWRRRNQLSSLPAAPSWLGLGVTSAAMGVLLLGVLGAENFLSRVSLLILLAGLTIQFRGWRFFRGILFPWAVLFLMVPLPTIVLNQIALPFQILASRLGTSLIALAGIPVMREGNVIQLPSLSLEVAEACSGLRSLATLITMGVFYGHFCEPRTGRRLFLVASAIPVAIVANAFRIMITGLIGEYWSPEHVEGFVHTFSGIGIFALSLALLMLVHYGSERICRHARSWRAA